MIRTGEPQLIPEIPEEFVEIAAPEPAPARGAARRSASARSLIVPLRARGRVIGDLALATAESGRRYGPEDLALAQELADRCALALDNARLYAELSEAVDGARRAGEEVNTILGGVADAVTAQAPDGTLVYANEAAVRMVGYDSVEELLAAPPGEVAGRFEMTDEHGGPLAGRAAPGPPRAGRRAPRAADRPQPHGRDARVALDARQVDPGVRRRTARSGWRST